MKFRCGRGDIEDLAFGCMKSILVIHESRLQQMRGAGYEAVVLHRKYPATKQMQRDRLAYEGKIWLHKVKLLHVLT